MNNNPFASRPLHGRDLVLIMRDINRIEASLESIGNGIIDIMIVIDTSGSMDSVINAVKANFGFIFTQAMVQIPDARIGLVEQGDWNKNSIYRCQPTRDTTVFQAAINEFGSCSGLNEAYVDSLIMAIQETPWREEATKLVIIIGDERADQPARSGKTWSQAIDIAVEAGVTVAMIVARTYSLGDCRVSYTQAADATGGMLLVAPSSLGVVSMLIQMVGHFIYGQTEFFRYTTTAKESLGTPDGGILIPADSALANTPFMSNPIVDMRNAVVGIVNTHRLKTQSGRFFNWMAGSANNLYLIAMGDRTRYGGTGAPRYTWTRTTAQLLGAPPYDLDIGEVYECVSVLKTAAGV